nr:hypothetical protein [Candidatus Gracilibacteria bacterium]
MKKIILLVLYISITFTYFLSNVGAVDFSTLSSKELSCPVSNINDIIYIPNGSTSYTTKIGDEFWATTDRYISNSGTLAKLWESQSGLVTCGTWNRYSEVAPGSNTHVVAIASDCTFNKPTGINKDVQFVFNIRHGAIGGGTATVTKQYYTIPGWYASPATLSYKTYNNYLVGSYVVDGNECYNLRIAWCGDGIIDSTHGETCDDGNNINGDGCSATCQTEPSTPLIQIDKRDANPDDLDGNIGNDTQTVNIGSGAIFKIRVTNNGTESLKNLVLTDALSPNCAGNVTLPSTYPASWGNFTSSGAGNHTNNTLEPGEFFEYTCSKANTIANYTNSATVNGVGVVSGIPVNANDTTFVIIPTGPTCNTLSATPSSGPSPLTSIFNCNATSATSYKIEVMSGTTILNTINNSTGSYTFSNTGSYTARCTINGTITSTGCLANISVNPPGGPTCNTLSATPSSGPSPLTSIFNCNATSATSYKIEVMSGTTILNTINNSTGSYTFSNTGSYTARCTINGTITSPGCLASITATDSGPSCGTAGGHTFSYSETNWGTYTFCDASSTPSPNPPIFPSQGGSTSWTCNGVGGTSVTCNASRGSTGPTCLKIEVSDAGSTANKTFPIGATVGISCYGSANTEIVKLECGNGTSSTLYTTSSGNFNCTYSSAGTYNPTCYIGNTATGLPTETSFTCNTKVAITGGGGGGGKGYCGDGVVQRPNDSGINEECDKTLVNGILKFPDWCTSDCKTINWTTTGEDGPIITYPNGGNILIFPNDTKVIIGQGSDPIYNVLKIKPYVKNNSSEDIYLTYPLCVYKTNSNLIGASPYCGANIGWLYPGVEKELNYSSSHFIGATVPNNLNYLDSSLKVTLGGITGFNYSTVWPFFTKTLDIRISKPAIATVGGGTSLIKNTNQTADINKVAGDGYSNTDKNKNFVGAGVSTGGLSTYTNKVSTSTSVEKISSGQTNQVTTNVSKISNVVSSGNKSITDSIPNYNGLSNVYIVKGGNLTINSSINGFGAKTYIVEGGNLYINQNINYGDNIAFVVKGGDIRIAANVTNINGTYITIPVSGIGGNIISGLSSVKLVINGSLYGDISSLVSNRTYVQNTVNNIINVGTVVSFGSNLFRQPAPLVGDFIGEYMKSQKVAK